MSNFRQFMPVMVQKFEVVTSSKTWTLPSKIIKDSSGNAEVIISAIGGGGGGSRCTNSTGYVLGAGGCSGEYLLDHRMELSGNLSITIGTGGAGASAGTGQGAGSDGTNTVVGSITLQGGEAGDYGYNRDFNDYASWLRASDGRQTSLPGIAPIGGNHVSVPAQCAPGARGGRGGFMKRFSAEKAELGSGGGGGLILDHTRTYGNPGKDGSTFTGFYCGAGGFGYGAGGGGAAETNPSATNLEGGDGADGAVLIEWWEYP